MTKQKYYVVWSGKMPGIYTSWEECKKQVIGVKGAKYKSYPTKQLAEEALKAGRNIETPTKQQGKIKATYIMESVSVDAACSGNPGDMEYRGVYTKNGKEIFHYGPVSNGTNNIGEFLAIVHALALLKEKNSSLPIYSDSQIAINWVKKKRANTTIEKNDSTQEIWNLLDRAHKWLDENTFSNKLLKWETRQWGEIKADFGRK